MIGPTTVPLEQWNNPSSGQYRIFFLGICSGKRFTTASQRTVYYIEVVLELPESDINRENDILVGDQLGAKRALQQQVAGAEEAPGGIVCY
jgi:hypothetical protein